MPLPFHLGLRENNHMVSLVRTSEGARPQLGVAYPQAEKRRSHIPANWGINAQSPRQSEAATINLPLSRRAQTILSYQLDPLTVQQINGGLSPMVHSRCDILPGIKQRIHIGHGHVDMKIHSHQTDMHESARMETPLSLQTTTQRHDSSSHAFPQLSASRS